MKGGAMESQRPPTNHGERRNGHVAKDRCGFQMPLHYPRYTRSEYEAMPEWKLDCLLNEYGLYVCGDVDHKRNFAMGAFLWWC